MFTASSAFVPDRFRPYKFVFQLIVSVCQQYGDRLIYLTEIVYGFKHTELWDPVNFWFYFSFLNIIWIIVPIIYISDASINLTKSQIYFDAKGKKLQQEVRDLFS